MNKKKIVLVYHSLHIGGAEKELLAYIEHLDRKTYNIHLVLTHIDGELLSSVPKFVKIHCAQGNSYKPDFLHLINLFVRLRAIDPDVVVGFMQDICFNILLVRTILRLKFKTIVSEQVVLSQWQIVMKTSWVKKKLIKILYKKADACFAQSESIFEDLKTNFDINTKKLYLVPSYVSPKIINQKGSRENQINKLSPYFLYMGRLVAEKNIEVLLSAFQHIYRYNRQVKLVIVGPHLDTYFDSVCSSLKIQNRVIFEGYTDSPGYYYSKALALVIPSPIEGRSRVMIEAMITSCPVICADFPGHERYIRHLDTGLTYPSSSIEKLAHLLTYVLNHNREVNQMASRARDYISKKHLNIHFYSYPTKLNLIFKSVIMNHNP